MAPIVAQELVRTKRGLLPKQTKPLPIQNTKPTPESWQMFCRVKNHQKPQQTPKNDH